MSNIQPMVFDIDEITKLAENNDGLACYILARSYDSEENNVEQNFEKAVYWYKKGHEINDPRCTYGLGACYYFGDGVEQNQNKAYELFIKAYPQLIKFIEEEKEFPNKQAFSKFCLGAYYYFGLGNIKKDDTVAFKLIYDSAMNGHIAGIYDLGANFYYNGIGTEKNLQLSKYYLELASNAGLPRATRKLEEYKNKLKSNKKIK